MKLLIVGAGPTGLTAALKLAKYGILPDIIDKKDSPSKLSRAVGILPASMQIFESLGVAEIIRKNAISCQQVIIHQNTKPILHLAFEETDDVNHHLFALAQDRTEFYLQNAFEQLGGKVKYSNSCVTLKQTESSVKVQLDNYTKEYDYVIGADGIESTVRQTLKIPYPGIQVPEKWSIADIECTEWPHASTFCVYLCPKGQVVIIIPMEPTRYRVVSNTADALALLPIKPKIDKINHEAKFTIQIRQASCYQVGRVFLAGDAAHCHSPVGGRGMNLGIADAADLADRFISGGLEKYHQARHKEGKRIIEFTERARRLITSQNFIVHNLLISGLKLMDKFPVMQRSFINNILTF